MKKDQTKAIPKQDVYRHAKNPLWTILNRLFYRKPICFLIS